MTPYNKLFRQILRSSIWREDDRTLRVWIGLLADKDENGFVLDSDMNLAEAYRVPLADFQAAIKKFGSPDPASGRQENEGRRVERVVLEGRPGFRILNSDYYRGLYRLEIGRERARDGMKAAREAHREAVNGKDAGAIKEIFDAWNKLTALPKCLLISDKRRRTLAVRLNDAFFVENWNKAMMKLSASRFCLGENDRGWRATFDWFIQPDSVTKIMEGKYDQSNQRNTAKGVDRNAGTANAKRIGQYDNIGKVI